MTKTDYLSLLQGLLPEGEAWNKESDSNLTTLLDAMAEELARLDTRADDLIKESDPSTTMEMMTDWERVCGLPDECAGELNTLQERRKSILGILSGTGGQSKNYFITLAKAFGFEVTIEECLPFRVGYSSVGDPLSSLPDWKHTWIMNIPESNITHFSAGQSSVGEPIRYWGFDNIECAISRRKPAHTHVIFAYNL